jgi:hypothetical protein
MDFSLHVFRDFEIETNYTTKLMECRTLNSNIYRHVFMAPITKIYSGLHIFRSLAHSCDNASNSLDSWTFRYTFIHGHMSLVYQRSRLTSNFREFASYTTHTIGSRIMSWSNKK